MNKDKQIEEMAKDFCAVGIPCEECHLYRNRCHAKKYATRGYNAGYRLASDVAEDIIKMLRAGGIDEWRYPIVADIKKKYTESEK